MKKWISLTLAILLTASVLPISVFAALQNAVNDCVTRPEGEGSDRSIPISKVCLLDRNVYLGSLSL